MKNTIKNEIMGTLAALLLSAMIFPQTGMAGDGMMMREMPQDSVNTMMMQMSKNYGMMNMQFSKMREHMQMMMKMNDMKALHSEMQKHMEMMNSMHKMMDKQQNMYHMMMGSEGTGHMEQMEHMEGMRGKTMEKNKPESMEKKRR